MALEEIKKYVACAKYRKNMVDNLPTILVVPVFSFSWLRSAFLLFLVYE